ncbi:uncharacterized protein LOC141695467 [Apium graveolens]|uniref:uncharacterized protein LOC141695467 n=1 Tax=Apium graveolens TaxID=4045 RepID=UPI003D7AF232
MIVEEYEKKFTELARFVGDYMDTDEKRAKRVQQGLNPWLQSRVAAFELATYAEVVRKAMCNSKGHYANDCRNLKTPVTCFKCGKTSHMSRNCKAPGNNKLMQLTTAPFNQAMTSYVPTLQLPSNQSFESATPEFPPSYPALARTFNMNIKDVVQSSEVMAGTLYVNNTNAKVLFDSSPTRSFISESFVDKLSCEIELLVEPLSIILANQERVSVKNICPRCKVEISGYSFPASLIPFQLGECDVILGMDWLAEYGAQIDRKKKKVILKSPQEKKVEFKGINKLKPFFQ